MEKEQLDCDRIFVVRDFLTPAECEQFIARSEAVGYGDAPITTAAGFVMRKDVRNNERVMVDDPDLTATLFERAKPFLPAEWFGWELADFNERWRFYRYDADQYFAPHTDGYYQRDNGDRSHLTFMIYLNDGFEGGATCFDGGRQVLRVTPRAGMALVFSHKMLHEGEAVRKGRKYVLRTDVMYRNGGGARG